MSACDPSIKGTRESFFSLLCGLVSPHFVVTFFGDGIRTVSSRLVFRKNRLHVALSLILPGTAPFHCCLMLHVTMLR